MTLTYKDGKLMLALFAGMFVIAVHIALGYVVSTVAMLVMCLSYISTYKMNSNWLTVAWVLHILICYVAVDIITYNPEGISSAMYKHMLSMLLAQLYVVLLCIACTLSKRKAYKDKTKSSADRIKKINDTLSLLNFYTMMTSIVIVIGSIYNAVKDTSGIGNTLLVSNVIVILVIAAVHMVSYADTVLLIRAIKKEDESNEVSKESSDGEGSGQDIQRGPTD